MILNTAIGIRMLIKYHRIILIGVCLLLCLTGSMTFADNAPQPTTVATPTPAKAETFSIQNANKAFDQLSIELSTQNLKSTSLSSAIARLEGLQQQAADCQKMTAQQLKGINEQLAETPSAATPAKTNRVDINYLQDKKRTLEQRGAECRLFVLRTTEALQAYSKTLQTLTTSKLLTRALPIWQYWLKPALVWDALSQLKITPILKTLKIQSVQGWLTACIIFLIALLLGLVLRFGFKIESDASLENIKLGHIIRYNLIRASAYLPITLVLLGLVAFNLFEATQYPPILFILLAIAAYAIYHIVIKWVLYPYPLPPSETNTLPMTKHALYRRMNLLGLTALIFGIAYYVLVISNVAAAITQSLHTIAITLMAALTVWIIALLNRLFSHKFTTFVLSLVFTALFLVIVIAEWLGYYVLAEYLLLNLFLSVFGYLGIIVLSKLLKAIAWCFLGQNFNWQTQLRRRLGISGHHSLFEISLFNSIGHLIILLGYIAFLLEAWGGNSVYPDHFYQAIFNGFDVAHITVIPARILIAALLFILLSLLGRWFSSHIARQQNSHDGHDTQVAIASIVSYISFAVSLLIALLVAGVNFTGLAIIAGALSIGIGLGLQDIVNNFVSGIILLLEKPIHPGDRIIIGNTEGFVRKIHIRSTRIATIAKSDVIVPNADLIKNQVTNYMFHDRRWRISCQVGVAYGSDTDKVKNTLLQVASQYEEIIQEGLDEPAVLFRQFGDSSLVFELWCVITDVNKKYKIQSDLNFAIDTAFRKAGITIAFPQRDVHIYQHDSKS